MTGLKVAVLTLVHGRHEHLTAQVEVLSQSHRTPDLYLVAAMDDPAIPDVVERAASSAAPADEIRVVPAPARSRGLPLARSRNAAAAAAIATGTNLLVFLDVDCLPSPRLVERYVETSTAVRQGDSGGTRPTVLAGTVHYLPPRRPGQRRYTMPDLHATAPHPARPAPPPDQVWPADDPLLFWSLSFAITTQDWLTLGGFDEDYEGYGGEDTDFAMRLAAHDGRLLWVGGAPSYHQYHDVEDPPLGHLTDIVDNSNRFHARWGFFPMDGWLSAFAANGLIRRTGSPPRWRLTAAGHRAARTS
jgi:N-acetylglucosaminyl-diphospho-decaprenol L-rhamnosyltransferase